MTILVTAALVGCGGEKKPVGFPPIYPVTLHVTQEGKPLEGASVALVAPDGSVPWVVGGTTDADGNVKLRESVYSNIHLILRCSV